MKHYRLCPCPMFDIAGTQRWLEQQSARGYHVDTSFFWQIAGFEKGEPKSVRYRLDAAPTRKGTERGTSSPDWGTYLSYQELGWEYVSSRNHFHIYASEDPNAPELHTDPQIQAMSLKLVSDRLLRSVLWTIPLFLIWLFRMGSEFSIFSFLVNGSHSFSLAAVAAYGVLLLIQMTEFLWMIGFRRALSRGTSPSPFSPVRSFFALLMDLLPWLMAALMVHAGFAPSVRDQAEQIPLSRYPAEVKVPMVQELLPQAEFTELESWVYPWQTAASPENYELLQFFDLKLPDGTEVSGAWSVTRCQTADDWIALGYAETCTEFDPRYWTLETLPYPSELDHAVVYRLALTGKTELDSPSFVLCQDNVVLIAHLNCYDGTDPVDYRIIADALAEALK